MLCVYFNKKVNEIARFSSNKCYLEMSVELTHYSGYHDFLLGILY